MTSMEFSCLCLLKEGTTTIQFIVACCSHAELLAEFGPKVLLIFLIIPVLLPNLYISVAASSSIHLRIDLACSQILVVVSSELELLKVIILLEELIDLLLLLLVFDDGSGHFTL